MGRVGNLRRKRRAGGGRGGMGGMGRGPQSIGGTDPNQDPMGQGAPTPAQGIPPQNQNVRPVPSSPAGMAPPGPAAQAQGATPPMPATAPAAAPADQGIPSPVDPAVEGGFAAGGAVDSNSAGSWGAGTGYSGGAEQGDVGQSQAEASNNSQVGTNAANGGTSAPVTGTVTSAPRWQRR